MRAITSAPLQTSDPHVRPLGYQPSLDGIRAIAVVSVIVYHFHQTSAPGGWAGVQLFFVLSGFLITSLLLSESASTGRISVGRFYMRRALRLLPALVVMLVVYTVLVALTSNGSAGRDALVESLQAMTYGYNWFTIADGEWNELAHLWSLSVEEQFYLVWPVVMAVVLWVRRPSAAARAGAARLLTVIVVGVVASAWYQGYLLEQGHKFHAVAGTEATAYPILAGCLLAALRGYRLVGGGAMARLKPLAAPIGLVAYLAVVLLTSAEGGHATRLLATVASLLLIVGLIDSPHTLASRALAIRPLRAVGRVSYGLYLWHIPAILLASRFAREAGLPSFTKYLLAVVGMVVATVASYRFVELRFLRMKDRFEPARATADMAVEPT